MPTEKLVTVIEETRTISTEKGSDGSIIRTETIVTKAPNEALLKAHLATVKSHEGQSVWERVFGRPA